MAVWCESFGGCVSGVWGMQDNVCGIAVGYLFFYGYLARCLPSEVPSPHPASPLSCASAVGAARQGAGVDAGCMHMPAAAACAAARGAGGVCRAHAPAWP